MFFRPPAEAGDAGVVASAAVCASLVSVAVRRGDLDAARQWIRRAAATGSIPEAAAYKLVVDGAARSGWGGSVGGRR